jgi:hypothetical protein
MPSFKPKTNKKIKYNKKNAVTLDNKHKEFINEFAKDENNRIPELQNEKLQINKQLSQQDIIIETKLELLDKLKEINIKIKELKNKKKEYFLDNSKYIFEYFENKKNISNCDINNDNTNNSKSKLVNTFFKIKQDTDNISTSKSVNNSNIVQKYLSNIDDVFLDINAYVFPTDILYIPDNGKLCIYV